MDFSNIPTPENEKVENLGFQTICKKLLPEFNELSEGVSNKEDKIKVFVRIRPFIKDEILKHDLEESYIKIQGENSLLIYQDVLNQTKNSLAGKIPALLPPQKFTFSKIFNEKVCQQEFFDQTTFGMINDFINGQNCLIFTYGVTNSGKTYTMMGEPTDPGVMPRAMDVIFNSMNGRLYENCNIRPIWHSDVERMDDRQMNEHLRFKEALLSSISSHDKLVSTISCSTENIPNTNSDDNKKPEETFEQEVATAMATRKREEARFQLNASAHIRYSVWVSMVEIYNDVPFDLLVPLPKKKATLKRVPLKLKEDGHGLPYVKDLKEINVTSADEAFKLLAIGKRNLQISTTSLNHVSSRSHCIFNVKLIKVGVKEDPMVAQISTLSLCDLAGSEPNWKSGNVGDRFKEANNINNSLMILGRCIKALRNNQINPDIRKHTMIPFRESKLTKLFQNFLVGKGQASMIVQINKLRSMMAENLNAIKFSAVTKQVVMVPVQMPLVSMKNLDRRIEDLVQPEAKKKKMSIEWANGVDLEMDRHISENSQEDDLEDSENDINPNEDSQVHLHAACTQRELELKKMLKQIELKLTTAKAEWEEREVVVRDEMREISDKYQQKMEEFYKQQLYEQAEHYEDKLERRINYCLEDLQTQKLDFEKTIAALQDQLRLSGAVDATKLIIDPKTSDETNKPEDELEAARKGRDVSEAEAETRLKSSNTENHEDIAKYKEKLAKCEQDIFEYQEKLAKSEESIAQFREKLRLVEASTNELESVVDQKKELDRQKQKYEAEILMLEEMVKIAKRKEEMDSISFNDKLESINTNSFSTQMSLSKQIDDLKLSEIFLKDQKKLLELDISNLRQSEAGLIEKVDELERKEEVNGRKMEKLLGQIADLGDRVMVLAGELNQFAAETSSKQCNFPYNQAEMGDSVDYKEIVSMLDMMNEDFNRIKMSYEFERSELSNKIKALLQKDEELFEYECRFKIIMPEIQRIISFLKTNLSDLQMAMLFSEESGPLISLEEEPMDVQLQSLETASEKMCENVKLVTSAPLDNYVWLQMRSFKTVSEKMCENVKLLTSAPLNKQVWLHQLENDDSIIFEHASRNADEKVTKLEGENCLLVEEFSETNMEITNNDLFVPTFESEYKEMNLIGENANLVQLDNLKKVISDLNLQINNIQSSKAELEQHIKCLENEKINDLNNFKQLQNDNINYVIKIDSLKNELLCLNKLKSEEMNFDLDNYISQINDLKTAKDSFLQVIKEFENKHEKLNLEITKLKEKLSYQNTIEHDRDNLRTETNQLRIDNDVFKEKLSSLEECNRKYLSQSHDLEELNSKYKEQIEELETKLRGHDRIEKEKLDLQDRIVALSSEINRLQAADNLSSTKINELQEANKLISFTIEKLQNSKHEFKNKIKELNNQLIRQNEVEAINSDLNKKINELSLKITDMASCSRSSDEKMKKLVEIKNENEETIDELKKKITGLVEAEINLRNENMLFNKNITDLKNHIAELQLSIDQTDKLESDFENIFLENQADDFKTTRSKIIKKTTNIKSVSARKLTKSILFDEKKESIEERPTRSSKRRHKLHSNHDDVLTQTPDFSCAESMEKERTPRTTLTLKLRSKK